MGLGGGGEWGGCPAGKREAPCGEWTPFRTNAGGTKKPVKQPKVGRGVDRCKKTGLRSTKGRRTQIVRDVKGSGIDDRGTEN